MDAHEDGVPHCASTGRKRRRCGGSSISRIELVDDYPFVSLRCAGGAGGWNEERCFTPEWALDVCAAWWGGLVAPSDIAHMLDKPYMPDIDECAPSRFTRAYLALVRAFGVLTRPGDAPEPLLQSFENLLSDVWAQLSEDDMAFVRMFAAAPDEEQLRVLAYFAVPGNRPYSASGKPRPKPKTWR